jgi:hypothetical protein
MWSELLIGIVVFGVIGILQVHFEYLSRQQEFRNRFPNLPDIALLPSLLRSGDLIFNSGSTSVVGQSLTHMLRGVFIHVGMVVEVNGKLGVWEMDLTERVDMLRNTSYNTHRKPRILSLDDWFNAEPVRFYAWRRSKQPWTAEQTQLFFTEVYPQLSGKEFVGNYWFILICFLFYPETFGSWYTKLVEDRPWSTCSHLVMSTFQQMGIINCSPIRLASTPIAQFIDDEIPELHETHEKVRFFQNNTLK